MKIPGPHEGQVFLVWVTFPLPEIKMQITIDGVQGKSGSWGLFMDVFIFLFSGVHFLFLFLLATLEVASDKEIGIIFKAQ